MNKTTFLRDNFNLIEDNAAAPADMQEREPDLVSQHQAHHGFELFEGHT